MSPDPEFEKKNQDSKQDSILDSILDSIQDKVENSFEIKDTVPEYGRERGGQDLPKSLTENLEKITKGEDGHRKGQVHENGGCVLSILTRSTAMSFRMCLHNMGPPRCISGLFLLSSARVGSTRESDRGRRKNLWRLRGT